MRMRDGSGTSFKATALSEGHRRNRPQSPDGWQGSALQRDRLAVRPATDEEIAAGHLHYGGCEGCGSGLR